MPLTSPPQSAPVLAPGPSPVLGDRLYVRVGKPLMDGVLAAVALVLALPILVLIAAVVFISLGSPLIFAQERVGQGGARFTVYKFRTMHQDRRRRDRRIAGPERRRTHKSLDDPRLTPTGRLLRRWSLDELPQLFNVIRGEMSLVGPRPELPQIIDDHYEPWMHRRHVVKPGMTGMWQVSERGNGMMHEHIDVDLDYVEQVSLRTDLGILARTLPAALTTHQGY